MYQSPEVVWSLMFVPAVQQERGKQAASYIREVGVFTSGYKDMFKAKVVVAQWQLSGREWWLKSGVLGLIPNKC